MGVAFVRCRPDSGLGGRICQPQKDMRRASAGRYNIQVVDLVKHPQLAAGDQILAIPTLVRKLPQPLRNIVGDLRDTERALVGLQLRQAGPKDKLQAVKQK
jgi:hypothetical protein